jgi:exodeoxyribonuclease VII small subunit
MTAKKESPVDKLGYEEAMADLEAILAELEAEETDLDRLADRIKRASELVKHCREKIHGAELEVEKVLKELPAEAEAKGDTQPAPGSREDPPF